MTLAIRSRTALALVVLALLAAGCPAGSDSESANREAESATNESDQGTVGSDGTVPVPIAPDPDPTLLLIDTDVRTGVLENGLSYYVRSNDSPGTRLELRLVVRAGSLQQDVPDSGLAHFVEHMLFNGTEAFTGNELDLVLQEFGLQIGADLNAYTTYDETVYSLSLPTSPDAIDTGFQVLSEWASKATLEQQAVIDERGVVREEHRLRAESADGVIATSLNDLYVADSGYEGYEPIGTPDQILATTSNDTRRFYDRWYRPDLMAVVAVGDVTADALEEEIVRRFSSLEDRSDQAERTSFESTPVDTPASVVITHSDAGRPSISLDLPIPVWDPMTVGGDSLILIEAVIDDLIAGRLQRQVENGSLNAIVNGAGSFSPINGRRFLGFNVTGEDLVEAGEDLMTEVRRIESGGFSQSEVDLALSAAQTRLDSAADSLGSRQDGFFAAQYVGHFVGQWAAESFEDRYRRQSAQLSSLSVDELNNHLRFMLADSVPLLAALGSDPAELPSEAELDAAIERSRSAGLGGPAEQTERVSVLMEAPDPIEEVGERPIPGLDAVEWTFANGARVLFVESDIHAGQVDVRGRSEGGWSILEPGDGPLADLAALAVNRSGVGELSSVELDDFLADSSAFATASIGETGEVIRGSAVSDDAESLFQLIHLRFAQPRVDPAAFREAVETGRARLEQVESDPSGRSFAALTDARYNSSPWQVIVAEESILDDLTAADLESIHVARFGGVDDLVLGIAGDISTDVVLELARTYIATLPAGDADSWVDRQGPPPGGVTTRRVEAGNNGSGAGVDFLYTASTFVDETVKLIAEIVQNIVEARLFEAVREDLGATYGGQVSVDARIEPADEIETLILVSGDPDRLTEIHSAVVGELESLANDGPSFDEFNRARLIAVSDHELVSNADLITMLHRAASGEVMNSADVLALLENITLADVSALSREMFGGGQRIEVFRG